MHRYQPHVENLLLRASEIALGSQLKKEREMSQRIMTDAESAVRFHPFQTPLFFTPSVILVSHFIIGRPFHNDGHVLAVVALGACAYS